jgi:hypothetical protein
MLDRGDIDLVSVQVPGLIRICLHGFGMAMMCVYMVSVWL